jgi:cobalt/nickel transport system ATP-binding protein
MVEKAVEIRNLSYSYPDGTEALCDVSLEVCEGEAVGIIGPNGAGKSTLLLHLNGILRKDGKVRIFSQEINDSNLAQIRSKVGLVFQDPDSQLFMPTVFDDVSFGPINMRLPKAEIEKAVDEALREVDMLSSIRRSSHHLSFGEKKRVSIATVLSMKPRLLVLDEPSSNLDPKHRRDLLNLLKQLRLTKIIATHDLDLVGEICSRVVLIDKGKIVAQGRTADILGDRSLLERHSLESPYSFS